MRKPTKRIDKLYYRGSRLRREPKEKRAHKAPMKFRGKGAKIERRRGRRVKKG